MNSPLFKTSFGIPQPNAAIAPQTLCPSTHPLVLFPVRLETRFFKLANGDAELRIRVYPDRIHVDSHHPELTTDERTFGTQYWQQDWLIGPDPVARADAWRTLANRFGAPRAAWIARTLKPTNFASRPTAAVPPGKPPAVQPTFPVLPPVVGPAGESAWRTAPMARLLPDRWTAIAHSAGKAILSVTGKDIRKPLAVGPDPQAPQPNAATQAAIAAGNQLGLDPGMKWLVDFDEAVAAGMAMRLTVPAAVLAAGIDSLVVLGVAKADPAATASQVADLLDAHAYTDGLEFLRLGAPTNNTDDQRAAYSTDDPDQARSFQNEIVRDPTRRRATPHSWAPHSASPGRESRRRWAT